MPRHHHYHHHYHGYRRTPSNPICSLIYCTILIGFFIFIIWNTTGFYAFGYFTPFIGIILFVAISGIIAAIVNAARRKARLQAQTTSTVGSPTGYPPQPGAASIQPVQPVTYSNPTSQPVPQPRPIGYAQAPTQFVAPVATPATLTPAKFCTYCGTTVESGDQRFCANCGAAL